MLSSHKPNNASSFSACQTLLFITNNQLWLLGKLLVGMCTSYSLWSQFLKACAWSCWQVRETGQLNCGATRRLRHGAKAAIFCSANHVWNSFAICTTTNKLIPSFIHAHAPALSHGQASWGTMCLRRAGAGWDLHLPTQREGSPA